MFKIQCGSCGQFYNVKPSSTGKQVKCKKCFNIFIVRPPEINQGGNQSYDLFSELPDPNKEFGEAANIPGSGTGDSDPHERGVSNLGEFESFGDTAQASWTSSTDRNQSGPSNLFLIFSILFGAVFLLVMIGLGISYVYLKNGNEGKVAGRSEISEQEAFIRKNVTPSQRHEFLYGDFVQGKPAGSIVFELGKAYRYKFTQQELGRIRRSGVIVAQPFRFSEISEYLDSNDPALNFKDGNVLLAIADAEVQILQGTMILKKFRTLDVAFLPLDDQFRPVWKEEINEQRVDDIFWSPLAISVIPWVGSKKESLFEIINKTKEMVNPPWYTSRFYESDGASENFQANFRVVARSSTEKNVKIRMTVSDRFEKESEDRFKVGFQRTTEFREIPLSKRKYTGVAKGKYTFDKNRNLVVAGKMTCNGLNGMQGYSTGFSATAEWELMLADQAHPDFVVWYVKAAKLAAAMSKQNQVGSD